MPRAPSRAGRPRRLVPPPGAHRRRGARGHRRGRARRVRGRPRRRQALRLVGRGRPRLVGSGDGSVVRVRADGVTVEGFDIDGRRGGDLARDSAGVHSAARDTTLRDLEIVDSLFGVYLREANGAVVERCRIRGIPGKDPGEKGSGIHAYNMEGFRFEDNEVVDVRDGLYLQNASKGDAPPQRGARRALRAPLHVLGRQRLRGQHLRERGGGHRHHVLGEDRLPPQPLPPEPRLRVGGPPLPGLRRRPRRGEPRRRQRPRRLHRGLAPHHPPRQRDRRLRRGGRALRPRRRPPLRGQLLRRQHVAPRPRGPADGHGLRRGTTGPATTSPTSTATAGATGPTASPASSTTSAGTSPRPTSCPTASPPRRSAPPRGRSPSCGWCRWRTRPRSPARPPSPTCPRPRRGRGRPNLRGIAASLALGLAGAAVLVAGPAPLDTARLRRGRWETAAP